MMFDLEFHLDHRPGALAELGEAMGRAGVPFEGGGVFACAGDGDGAGDGGGGATAHFLFRDGDAAKAAAAAAGIPTAAMHRPLVRKLRQGTPGQLGAIARALANAGVNILVQYSDHQNRLILICDDPERAESATEDWAP